MSYMILSSKYVAAMWLKSWSRSKVIWTQGLRHLHHQ